MSETNDAEANLTETPVAEESLLDLIKGEDDDENRKEEDDEGNFDSPTPNVPARKRKASKTDDESVGRNNDKQGVTSNVKDNSNIEESGTTQRSTKGATGTGRSNPIKRPPMSKAREIRLEQNRKAAQESRRRKKIMVEELQRSVIFFSKANGTLKQQNDELHRLLISAQAQVQALEASQRANNPATGTAVSQTTTQGDTQAGGVPSTASADGKTNNTSASSSANDAIAQAQQAVAASLATAIQPAAATGGTPAAAFGAASAPSIESSNDAATVGACPPGNTGANTQVLAFQQAYLQAMGMGAQGGGSIPNSQQTQTPHGAEAYANPLNQFALQQANFATLAGMPVSAAPAAQVAAAPGVAANPGIFQYSAGALQFANAANQMQASAAATSMGIPAGLTGGLGGSATAAATPSPTIPPPAAAKVEQEDVS